MTLLKLQRTVFILLLVTLLSATGFGKDKIAPSEELRHRLPDQVEGFRASGPIKMWEANLPAADLEQIARTQFGALSIATRQYRARDGRQFGVDIFECRSESGAYALLTNYWKLEQQSKDVNPETRSGDIGLASQSNADVLVFVQGSTLVHIAPVGASTVPATATNDLGKALAPFLDKGSNDRPVLIKHLPDWESATQHAVYAVSLDTLKNSVPNQPVLEAVNFDGGTEAVAAYYGPSQLVIVEFTTPQLAGDNDRNIAAKTQQLQAEGKPVPSAYRRVGNYSVFVFNAPDAQTANQLINQVSYEQVVRWLGDNPNLLAEAQRRYTETTLGVFISVVKASGLAAVICFGVGGIFGALLFNRRRAQQAAQQAYSDAGGMMRLNIDDLTAETNPHRLIGPGGPGE